MAILAGPIVEDTGWPLPWVIGTISLALTVAGLAAPHVGIWIVGQERYPALIGRLARPSLLAQAAAPILGGILVAGWGSSATLWVIAVLAAVNVAFAVFIFIQSRHRI
ncbi:hypothetical protein [Paracoccus hibiscisoli]|uniref:MFS transporter n=1 Tax=Paracoccus hibiscisoli TaxID=2023261 RepID=A0A4U0QTX6_9RHOB|nr:hypothetical protein [Paracoccus hibiscisoli]TJZ85485.1 hypothetical protein FA740_06230 [Paracoccus hibiscisoli]